MDFTTNFPPVQEGKTLRNGDVTVFGMSLQGASHKMKEPAVPCQDYSDFRFLEKEGLLLAAIADGVGSCKLSHWGAYVAVNAVLDSVERSITDKAFPGRVVFDDSMNPVMKQVMLSGFQAAREAVENWGDENGAMVYQLQSTLTLAIYDGKTVYHGHIGDDGIVALLEDGTVHMLTARVKGAEASSVYPLQTGEKGWRFGRSSQPVAGFFLATDGVLDAFVTNHPDYFGLNYNNGILYPFMSDAFRMLRDHAPDAADKAMEHYKKYMLGQVYQELVQDDLTLVAVVSNFMIQNAREPAFSVPVWQTIHSESNAFKRRVLSHKPQACIGLADFLDSLPRPGQVTLTFQARGGAPVPSLSVPAGTIVDLSEYTTTQDTFAFTGWYLDENCENHITSLQMDEDTTIYAGWNRAAGLLLLPYRKAAAVAAGAVLVGALFGAMLGKYCFPVISPSAYDDKVQEASTLTQAVGTLTQENAALNQQVSALTQEQDQAETQLGALNQQQQALQEQYDGEVEENQALTEQLEQLTEQLEALKDRNKLTEEDIQQIVEEYRAALEKAAQEAAEKAAAEQEADQAETTSTEPQG